MCCDVPARPGAGLPQGQRQQVEPHARRLRPQAADQFGQEQRVEAVARGDAKRRGARGRIEAALARELTRADLEQDQPYNTYRINGLPPGPIANPGRAAIEAVLKPAKTKDLYFVADGTGVLLNNELDDFTAAPDPRPVVRPAVPARSLVARGPGPGAAQPEGRTARAPGRRPAATARHLRHKLSLRRSGWH